MSNDVPVGCESATLSLVVHRAVAASPETVFQAWTDVEALKRWWGPAGITCTDAEVDLRVGGRYRLANQAASGDTLWITGVFDLIERPSRLVYSWAHEPVDAATQYTRVTVRFEPSDIGTDVTVFHELLATQESVDTHRQGWSGCLSGLAELFRAKVV